MPVLYIAGLGRSGSTLLSLLLAQVPGFVAVGELRSIWTALRDDERCGCGAPVSRCLFWQAVGEEAFQGWRNIAVEEMLRLDGAFVRHRNMPRLVLSASRQDDELVRYLQQLTRMYQAITSISGCDVIVDSTKDAPYLLLLSRARVLDLRLVHLVRDPRGVAYSMSKVVISPEHDHNPRRRGKTMPRRTAFRAAGEWILVNGLCEYMARRVVRKAVRIKYEQLVAHPAAELKRALLLTGTDFEVHDGPKAVDVKAHHTIGGNPMRFDHGRREVRLDDEWQTHLPWMRRALVTISTLPLSIPYGYVPHRDRR